MTEEIALDIATSLKAICWALGLIAGALCGIMVAIGLKR